MTDLITWAKKEVEIAHQKEELKDMAECFDMALSAIEQLKNDDPIKLDFTRRIFVQLLDRAPLTPIEDIPEEWGEPDVDEDDPNSVAVFQSKRRPSLFKCVAPNGHVEFTDTQRCVCIDINNPKTMSYHPLVNRIIDEMIPIKMPYMPSGRIKVYIEFFDRDITKSGSVIGILKVQMPSGQILDVKRFFKEDPENMIYEEVEYSDYVRAIPELNEEDPTDGVVQ